MNLPILYVAGLMTGYAEQNYPAFNAAADLLREHGYTVLNPVDSERLNPTPGQLQSWDWYMRHAMKMVLEAEAVALLPNWQESRGAKLEVHVARSLGMQVAPYKLWVDQATLGCRYCGEPGGDCSYPCA